MHCDSHTLSYRKQETKNDIYIYCIIAKDLRKYCRQNDIVVGLCALPGHVFLFCMISTFVYLLIHFSTFLFHAMLSFSGVLNRLSVCVLLFRLRVEKYNEYTRTFYCLCLPLSLSLSLPDSAWVCLGCVHTFICNIWISSYKWVEVYVFVYVCIHIIVDIGKSTGRHSMQHPSYALSLALIFLECQI